MRPPSGDDALEDAIDALARLTKQEPATVEADQPAGAHRGDRKVRVGDAIFLIEWKSSGSPTSIGTAVRQIKAWAGSDAAQIPLLAVPYMGQAGADLCAEAGIGWLDLSGNAEIHAPGLHIVVHGNPNRYTRRGRPANVFAPKSSRVARWLLLHPQQWWSQAQISANTGLSEGYVSKVTRKLEEQELIHRNSNREIRPSDADLMLTAWREAYDFSQHDVRRGHIPARSGDALVKHLARSCQDLGMPYAATGLAGAWLLDRFASFRMATVYLGDRPTEGRLKDLSFREDAHGANTWLVYPKDEGVFQGARTVDGVRCVHPIQVYLDLKNQPERATEAADHLRTQHLSWKQHAG